MIDETKFNTLAEHRSPNSISIYMPAHRSGQPVLNGEDRLRYKNKLQKATQELESRGVDEEAITTMMAPAKALLEESNNEFWHYMSDGFAVFISPDSFEYHHVPLRFEEFVYVGNEYYLRPLIPAMMGEGRFFVLALSGNDVRFFEGNKHSITPVKIDDLVPGSMEEALALTDGENSLQFHIGDGGSGTNAIFHGQGGLKDAKEKYREEYYRLVDKGLMKMLHDERVPMVIAAVGDTASEYKHLSDYKYIVDDIISGNPEQTTPESLHTGAWEILESHFNADYKTYCDEFGGYVAENKATTSVADAVAAAIGGRVEALFLDQSAHVYGTYDAENHGVRIDDAPNGDNIELLNLAAVRTFQQKGKVYNVPAVMLPESEDTAANAVMRYSY